MDRTVETAPTTARPSSTNAPTETGGITIGTEVWIPLFNLQDQSDLANVLTHELTHVAFNEQGIGDTLPTWVNEGTAWSNGLTAQSKISAKKVNQETEAYNSQISQVKQNGQLLPLTASETDILNASYNVEWEDYLAVQALIKQYGWTTYQTFLKEISTKGIEQSFQDTFNQTLDAFQSQFLQSLT